MSQQAGTVVSQTVVPRNDQPFPAAATAPPTVTWDSTLSVPVKLNTFRDWSDVAAWCKATPGAKVISTPAITLHIPAGAWDWGADPVEITGDGYVIVDNGATFADACAPPSLSGQVNIENDNAATSPWRLTANSAHANNTFFLTEAGEYFNAGAVPIVDDQIGYGLFPQVVGPLAAILGGSCLKSAASINAAVGAGGEIDAQTLKSGNNVITVVGAGANVSATQLDLAGTPTAATVQLKPLASLVAYADATVTPAMGATTAQAAIDLGKLGQLGAVVVWKPGATSSGAVYGDADPANACARLKAMPSTMPKVLVVDLSLHAGNYEIPAGTYDHGPNVTWWAPPNAGTELTFADGCAFTTPPIAIQDVSGVSVSNSPVFAVAAATTIELRGTTFIQGGNAEGNVPLFDVSGAALLLRVKDVARVRSQVASVHAAGACNIDVYDAAIVDDSSIIPGAAPGVSTVTLYSLACVPTIKVSSPNIAIVAAFKVASIVWMPSATTQANATCYADFATAWSVLQQSSATELVVDATLAANTATPPAGTFGVVSAGGLKAVTLRGVDAPASGTQQTIAFANGTVLNGVIRISNLTVHCTQASPPLVYNATNNVGFLEVRDESFLSSAGVAIVEVDQVFLDVDLFDTTFWGDGTHPVIATTAFASSLAFVHMYDQSDLAAASLSKGAGSTLQPIMDSAGAFVDPSLITLVSARRGVPVTVTGTPEGQLTGDVGSLAVRTDGGAATTFYVKESGTGKTGWIAK